MRLRAVTLQKEAREGAGPGGERGSCAFNLTLINRMESSATKRDLKPDPLFAMGKCSVSWHADSCLQDFSTIGTRKKETLFFSLASPPPVPTTAMRYRVNFFLAVFCRRVLETSAACAGVNAWHVTSIVRGAFYGAAVTLLSKGNAMFCPDSPAGCHIAEPHPTFLVCFCFWSAPFDGLCCHPPIPRRRLPLHRPRAGRA